MLSALKQFHCPSCSAPFCTREATRQISSSKFPLILPCHHAVCESCLNSAVRNKQTFLCAVCKCPTVLSGGKESISKLHPDVHALGVLTANRKGMTSFQVKMGPSQEMLKNTSPRSPSRGSTVMFCEICSHFEALWQCEECQQNFCTQCFDKAHKNVKGKKKHEPKKIFAEQYNTMVQEGCKEHKNKPIEFYCEKDDTLTCSHCMLVGAHIGHEVKSLVDKNMLCAEDLKTVIQEVSEVEKRLKYSEHLLAEVTSSEKVDASEYIKRVHDHFHKMHSILQLRESYLISQLESAASLQSERIENLMLEVSNYQKEISSVKRDAELVIENPCLAVSAPYLLKKLEDFKSVPCFLLPVVSNAEKKVEINLKLDTELDSALIDYGSVDYSVPLRFELASAENLPENFCMDIPDSFSVSDVESQSTTTLDNFSDDSLSSSSSKYGIAAAFKYRDFSRRSPEKVMVSHIKSPSCFYIQRCADQRKLNSISDAINRWCRSRDAQKTRPLEVEKGDLYLVQFSPDKKWYRGRVKHILEPGETYHLPSVGMKSSVVSSEVRTVKDDEVKVEVQYIDYGNTEVVSLFQLLSIQPRFLGLAGLAKPCSLVDILPVGEDWSAEANKTFTDFVQGKAVVMTTFEERNNVLQVDLAQVPDTRIENDVPVSVRDALVFLELAVFPGGKSAYGHRTRSETKFLPPERIRANAEIAAIVSHVDSPSLFYVQQVSTASYLSSLIVEMNETFSNDSNALLHSIFAPRAGMICAAKFSLDKQWYRAQVLSLPGGANVEVEYVDFGNKEVINHRYLRKLPDKFCKLNIQAIPCKLADVTFNQEKGWSSQAKEWLTSKVSKKQLTLKSLGYIAGENKTSAVLYFRDDEYEICVNALMVEEGLADSCGEYSTDVRVKLEVIEPPVPPPIDINGAYCRSLSHESDEEDVILPPVGNIPKPKPTVTKTFPESEGKHVKVVMSHIVSPGLFYVRIAGDMEKRLKKLVGEMQKTYTDLEIPINEAIVGNSYAVLSQEHGQWYRGTVLSSSGSKISVHFVDFGFSEEVKLKYIHKLLDQFAADEEYAIRCELRNIIPAGGSTEWSHKASEEFHDLVSKQEVLHLTCKVGMDKESKCLPVNLYIEEVILGGALEPTKIEYVNVAEELVNKGVALPMRKPSAEASCSKQKSPNKESGDCTEASSSGCETKPQVCSPEKETSSSACSSPNKCCSPEKKECAPASPKTSDPQWQWKPVVYPTEEKFKGYVTNIGEDGSVHLFVRKDDSSVVDIIRKALQFTYAKRPVTRLQLPPPPGEACIAKFPVDKMWYRAEVLTVYDNRKLKVNFVDYGNNEIIPLSDIRTDITMQTFPKQCLECTISGIHTGESGQFDEDLLNFLHSQLVETIVEVEVQGPPDEKGRLPCHLLTSCGISVAELLMSMGFLDESDVPEQQPKAFHKATDLKEGDIFPVCICHIDSPNIVFLQRLLISEPKTDHEKQYNKEYHAFLELVNELQEKAETFPPLTEPMPGIACCAKYSHDSQWYRCEIMDLTETGAVVLYVDYGNSEVQPLENLRVPDDNFIAFPVQIHLCKIHGMKPVEEEWSPEVKDFMVKKLCLSGQQIYAKVIMSGELSEVELLVEGEDGDMKLAYNELVEKNLILL